MAKIEKGRAQVELVDIEYDVNGVINLIDEINYPDAENIKKFFMGFGKIVNSASFSKLQKYVVAGTIFQNVYI